MFSFESSSVNDFKKPKNLSLFSVDDDFAAYPSMTDYSTTGPSALLTPTSPTYTPNAFRPNNFTDAFAKTVPLAYTFPTEAEFADFYAFVETPSSIQSATPANDDIFKFEPEHIEQYQQSCYSFDKSPAAISFDAEYMNYDEENCQSKDNSHCSSPDIDPWMGMNLRPASTPKPVNVGAVTEPALPSMDTAFGSQFTGGCILVDNNQRFDSPPNVAFVETNETNFNTNNDNKIHCEQKDLWSDPAKPINVLVDDAATIINTTIKEEPSSGDGMQCLWRDCYMEFVNQAQLVEHIEKRHVETRKGEEFSCHWHECARRQKPFNARYKLLIHMRVHSGEKPNKCQVR